MSVVCIEGQLHFINFSLDDLPTAARAPQLPASPPSRAISRGSIQFIINSDTSVDDLVSWNPPRNAVEYAHAAKHFMPFCLWRVSAALSFVRLVAQCALPAVFPALIGTSIKFASEMHHFRVFELFRVLRQAVLQVGSFCLPGSSRSFAYTDAWLSERGCDFAILPN